MKDSSNKSDDRDEEQRLLSSDREVRWMDAISTQRTVQDYSQRHQ